MRKQGNRGSDVDDILKDLDGVNGNFRRKEEEDNGIDLFGIEIDDIIKEANDRRGLSWEDDDTDVVMCLPHLVDPSSSSSKSARRPWRRMALVGLASLLAFFALIAVGYGIGYAISGGGGGGNRSPSRPETSSVTSSMMEVVSEIPTYSPTVLAPSTSPVEASRSVEVVSNDIPGDKVLYVYGLEDEEAGSGDGGGRRVLRRDSSVDGG
jgi:hypothetical protein